jgi:hypothetical protein
MQYVKDFEFPAEQGFTGSAGKDPVKGYMRGGHVKKDPVKAAAQKPRAPGPGAAHGGYAQADHTKGKGRSKRGMPGTVKAEGGSVHDKLRSEGEKMGYAYGGQVKKSNTSSEFLMKKKPMASMDTGVQPARKGRTQADVEAGGTKRLKPKFDEGGSVRKPSTKSTARGARVKETARIAAEESQERQPTTADTRRTASGEGMPRRVKARGGLARYARGGKKR